MLVGYIIKLTFLILPSDNIYSDHIFNMDNSSFLEKKCHLSLQYPIHSI